MEAPWLLFIVIGLITFGLRALPIALVGRREIPPLLLRGLRYVPPAVLSAIFVPEIVMPKGAIDLSFSNGRFLAGMLAILVAWRTKNVLLTIFVGMAALWILLALGVAK